MARRRLGPGVAMQFKFGSGHHAHRATRVCMHATCYHVWLNFRRGSGAAPTRTSRRCTDPRCAAPRRALQNPDRHLTVTVQQRCECHARPRPPTPQALPEWPSEDQGPARMRHSPLDPSHLGDTVYSTTVQYNLVPHPTHVNAVITALDYSTTAPGTV
jgi:hypothetical protein